MGFVHKIQGVYKGPEIEFTRSVCRKFSKSGFSVFLAEKSLHVP